jgi:hypothetical protein
MLKGNLIYQEHSQYDWWLKAMLMGLPLLTLILGFWFLTLDILGAAVMFGVTVLDSTLFYFIMPRNYQIYTDRLIIGLGKPLALTIPYEDIKEVKSAPAGSAMAYNGIRFVTSMKHVVEIQRRRGMNLVISPASGDMFMEQLKQAVQARGTLVLSSR